MELKDQVVNYELSKKLKELGVEQKSLWYWSEVKGNQYIKCQIKLDFGDYSAFTVAELGELLRPYQNFEWVVSLPCSDDNEDKRWMVGEVVTDEYSIEIDSPSYGKSEADVRAKQLIYYLSK